jgi:uncharacterized protein RhaS with RHS repeats
MTNGSGTIANRYTYDSFGKLDASTRTLTIPFHYTGHNFVTETGLCYYRARYYDPTAEWRLAAHTARRNAVAPQSSVSAGAAGAERR